MTHPSRFQLYGGLIAQSLHVELHAHVGYTVALEAAVGHMLATTTTRRLAKALNGRTYGVLYTRILDHTFQGLRINIARALLGE